MAAQLPDSPGEVHLLDGALGTELGRRGLDTRGALFSAAALLDERGRHALRDVHRAYVDAGAQIITAATFRTNRRALAAAGLAARFPELARIAVHEARSAAGGRARVAGSLAPVEDCYRPDLRTPPVPSVGTTAARPSWGAAAARPLPTSRRWPLDCARATPVRPAAETNRPSDGRRRTR